MTLDVQNPDQFKVVKKGDQVEVTYTEAIALSRRAGAEAGGQAEVKGVATRARASVAAGGGGIAAEAAE